MYKVNLELYDKIVAQCPNFERKGKTMPYTSANGHMFSLLNKDGELGCRFSKEIQEKYFEEFNTSYLISHNAKMKGYIRFTDEMLKNQELLIKLLNESYEYVMSLDPK